MSGFAAVGGFAMPCAPGLTANARAFRDANRRSLVVSGAATHKGAERPENVTGARYTLADGRSFALTSAELRSLPVPRWQI